MGTVDHEQASGTVAVGRSGNNQQGNNLRRRRAELVEDGRARGHTTVNPVISLLFLLSPSAFLAHTRLLST